MPFSFNILPEVPLAPVFLACVRPMLRSPHGPYGSYSAMGLDGKMQTLPFLRDCGLHFGHYHLIGLVVRAVAGLVAPGVGGLMPPIGLHVFALGCTLLGLGSAAAAPAAADLEAVAAATAGVAAAAAAAV